MNTASIETRPARLQYTSRRCKISANSSSTRAVPTPNRAAAPERQPGACAPNAMPATPPATMKITPNTM
jgi:hypothetical protein